MRAALHGYHAGPAAAELGVGLVMVKAVKHNEGSVTRFFLPTVLVAGFILRLWASRRADIVHPDEIFQVLEPAHRLVYGYGIVTWEWREGIRSWLLPGLFSPVLRIGGHSVSSAATYLFVIKILLASFSLVSIVAAYVWAKRAAGELAGRTAAIAAATWYQLVLYATHPLLEIIATHILLLSMALESWSDTRKRPMFQAFLAGAAVCIRIQMLPIVLVWLAVLLLRRTWSHRMFVLAGFATPVLLLAFLDRFTLGSFLQSWWKYLWENLALHRSDLYGMMPWNWYLSNLWQHVGITLLLAIVGIRKLPLFGGLVCLVLIVYSIPAHKEERFIYPMIPFIVTLAAMGAVTICELLAEKLKLIPSRHENLIYCSVALLTLSWLQAPAFSYWPGSGAAISQFDRLAKNSSLCGIGLYRVAWFATGGYTHLHRNIPIFVATEDTDLSTIERSANVMLVPSAIPFQDGNYRREQCSDDLCAYIRPAGCEDAGLPDLNAFLIQTGN